MNVSIENLGPCKKLARFEVTAEEVDDAFVKVTNDFCKQAAMPGFRPGKAPKAMVIKQYEAEIAEQAKRKVIRDSYQAAIKEHKLDVLGYPDIEQVQFAKGQPLVFTATIETSPEFQLPEYRDLPARRERRYVSEEDIARALDVLRNQRAEFDTADREVTAGDHVVVDYTGQCEGKPISEIAPTARSLNEQKTFWIEVKPDSFIPGFAMQLVGAKVGDQRTVRVDFPADFVTPELASKKGEFAVQVVGVKHRRLPELDNEFAKALEAEDLDHLREGVRQDLQNELNSKNKREVRNQIVRELLDRVQFELPDVLVQQETRNVVYDIVSENQQRGVSKESIEKQKDRIYSMANQSAQQRVKLSFLFQKIAAKEGIRATPEEINARVLMLAQSYKMPYGKFLKELKKRDGLPEIVQQIVHEKVIDFLEDNARVDDAEPAAND